MKCLSEEEIVVYLRGRGAEASRVEAHVRQCPACAMELLLAREALAELAAKSIQPGTERLGVVRPAAPALRRRTVWIPWAAAAAVLVAAILLAVLSRRESPPADSPPMARSPAIPKSPAPPPAAEAPRPNPRVLPPPPPAPPKAEPAPSAPAPKVAPPVSAPPPAVPATPPQAPPGELRPPSAPTGTEPVPKKPAPTLVEKAIVAQVVHSVGSGASAVGRAIRSGELLTTARSEFLEVAVEGYGQVFFRENSQAEIGASGDIFLHEGEMLARVDPERPLGEIRTPAAVLEPQTRLFNVLAGKTSTEISFLTGRFKVASALASGPSTVLVKSGKMPEIKPLEPGFASWIPDKLGAKRFVGWYEAEEFPVLQGFRAMPYEQSSGRQAAVQVADSAVLGCKMGLPFKGRYAVWVRVRQHEAKPVAIGIRLGGQSALDVKLEYSETKTPWRWVGPLHVIGDRLDIAIQAQSRWPLKEGEPARSFPVVIDAVLVTSDLKASPPEKASETSPEPAFSLEAPPK